MKTLLLFLLLLSPVYAEDVVLATFGSNSATLSITVPKETTITSGNLCWINNLGIGFLNPYGSGNELKITTISITIDGTIDSKSFYVRSYIKRDESNDIPSTNNPQWTRTQVDDGGGCFLKRMFK